MGATDLNSIEIAEKFEQNLEFQDRVTDFC